MRRPLCRSDSLKGKSGVSGSPRARGSRRESTASASSQQHLSSERCSSEALGRGRGGGGDGDYLGVTAAIAFPSSSNAFASHVSFTRGPCVSITSMPSCFPTAPVSSPQGRGGARGPGHHRGAFSVATFSLFRTHFQMSLTQQAQTALECVSSRDSFLS